MAMGNEALNWDSLTSSQYHLVVVVVVVVVMSEKATKTKY